MPYFNKETMEIENVQLDNVAHRGNVAERILNSILFGDPRGYGYSHPTPREQFEAAQKKRHD